MAGLKWDNTEKGAAGEGGARLTEKVSEPGKGNGTQP